jgi:hypothetical protein
MNRKTLVLFAFCVIIIPYRVYCQDGIIPFFYAEGYKSGVLTLNPVILPEAEKDRMISVRYRAGINDSWSATAKLATFGPSMYAGLDARYVWLTPVEEIQVELVGGFQHYDTFGSKLAAVGGYRFDKVWAYSGLDYQPYFRKNDVVQALLVPIGAFIPLFKNELFFTFEAGIPVTKDAESLQSVTFGLSWKLK